MLMIEATAVEILLTRSGGGQVWVYLKANPSQSCSERQTRSFHEREEIEKAM